MSNPNEYITNWSEFIKCYIKNFNNLISMISGLLTVIIPIVSNPTNNLDKKFAILSLVLCIIYPIVLTIKDLIKSLNSLLNKSIVLSNELEEMTKKFAILENNRDTIEENYKSYKANYPIYEKICNEICIAVDAIAGENIRNGAISRLKNIIDGIKGKYLMKGDKYDK